MSHRATRKNLAIRPAKAEDHGDKMSQICDLLFGEQLRDFDRRFPDTEQRLEAAYVLFSEGFELEPRLDDRE